jgi:choline kinase/thiamine kinase-like enzyme
MDELNQSMEPNIAFCILSAGRGGRLGSLTSKINKALLPLGGKPVISHIIDKIPTEYEIIICLGYEKEAIIEFCKSAYPERKFIFVNDKNYSGPRRGPGTGLLVCKEYLNRPFYMCCNDCVIDEPYPDLNNNWIGLSKISDINKYSTALVDQDGSVIDFINKSPNGHDMAFIGLAGIKDHELFWKKLEIGLNEEPGELVTAFYNPKEYNLLGKVFTWHDTGTQEAYDLTCLNLENHRINGIKKKINESTFIVNNKCVKYFGDPDRIMGRSDRAKILKDFIPNITHIGRHFIVYDLFEGQTLYEIDDKEYYIKFWEWCKNNLWSRVNNSDIKIASYEFYHNKTINRMNAFLAYKSDYYSKEHIISGVKCRSIIDYIEDIDWDYLSDCIGGVIHGDLQYDNVLMNHQGEFKLIDWRESFGHLHNYGDILYDLAKMYGGMIMNYNYMKYPKNYNILFNNDNSVDISWRTDGSWHEIMPVYEKWVVANFGENILNKIRLLTAIIYLNMSPLHTDGLDDLLYFKSKLMFEKFFNV